MENSDNSALGCMGVILGSLLVFATFFGIYHGFKKHDITTGLIATVIPPYAWYMSAEGFLWHDDYSDVNWEIRIPNDVKAIVSLIGSSTSLSPENQLQHGQAIEKLAAAIKGYPSLIPSFSQPPTNLLILLNMIEAGLLLTPS